MWLQSTKIYAYGVDIAPYILIPGSILFMAYVFVFVFDAPTARQEQTTSPNTVGVSLGTRTAAYNLKQTH